MKLISFAVVSLLAITVSAYPQQSTSTQDVQSYQSTSTPTSQQSQSTSIPTSQPSQSTSTNDAQSSQSTATPTPQPPYQDKVQVEIDRLTKIYEKEDDDFYRLNNDIQLAHETIVGIKDKIIDIDVQLKVAGIKAERRWSLIVDHVHSNKLLEKLRDDYKEYQQPYENAMVKRNNAKAELKLLKDNQILLAKYNSKYGVQAGPSPDSVYNLSILTKQNTDILKEIDELLAKYNRLETEDYIHLYDQNISISPNEELYSKILLLQSQNGIAERILGDYKPNRSIELTIHSHLLPTKTGVEKTVDFDSFELVSPILKSLIPFLLSDTIGLFLVETGIGPLLTRSLVSRVRLLERSVTKKTPINAICSSPDNDVFTLNVQGQLVRSQRWFWSRRTKQLYRNKYWLTPQARPKTVKQRHSFVLMETLRTCGDPASLQKYVTRQLLDTSGFFKDPSFDQSRAHGTSNWPSHSVWTSTSNSEITTQIAGSRTRSGCGECIYLAPRWSLKWRDRSGPTVVGRGLWSMHLWGRGMIIGTGSTG
ncbi:hypothetical protein BASA83_008428 [Batrachochytrium salamandrivorans]|nr:hypothetical protein BASA83_008428 [Batrachochytrium salamandrivorans]